MNISFFKHLKPALFFCLSLFFCGNASGSHIVGGDLTYTHVAGNTYRITLALYADCGPASAGAYTTLATATPSICIYDGSTFHTLLGLTIDAPTTGTEVTSLCPAGLITQCTSTSSAIPGIKKFTYSNLCTLPYTSSVWRFVFNGNYGTSTASRASAITNLTSPMGIMGLIDTLDNTVYANSSPTMTASQTTFFHLNENNGYNPAAVDPDGDLLTFSLVGAVNASGSCTPSLPMASYIAGYAWGGGPAISGANPLVVSAGSFNFDPSNGQLLFYPNTLQRATIVYNIREIRGGVLVGTSQREMTILVAGSSTPGWASFTSGPPTGGVAAIIYSCSGNDTLAVSGLCPDVSVQWQSSPDNSTWANIAGATSQKYPFTPAASNYYRCKVTGLASGLSSYSTQVHCSVGAAGILHSTVNYGSATECGDVNFAMKACTATSSHNVTTYFGDGNYQTSLFTGSSAGANHTYSFPGTYSVKHVLKNGSAVVDSSSYSVNYNFCRTLPIKLYFDNNTNCIYDGGDIYNNHPAKIQIDSNGVHIDTVTITSGFYYRAYGGNGTVYAFRFLSSSPGISASCSPVIYDTISAAVLNYPAKYLSLNCSPGSGFDLKQLVATQAGIHRMEAHIIISNAHCMSVTDTVTMSFTPKYYFESASPSPNVIAGNTLTWVLGPLSALTPAQNIHVTLERPLPYLLPGDTANSSYTTMPIIFDNDTTNNCNDEVDTVKSSWDPNCISVSPHGYIAAGTELTYTINFENMGNAPARNIHILDTIASYLLPGTLEAVGASHIMNLAVMPRGPYTIAKFEFPEINLPDTSHHNECHGLVVFKVKTKVDLPPGTIIPARAGIFFDENEVVMTNTVNSIIDLPTLILGPSGGNDIVYPNPATTELTIIYRPNAYNKVSVSNAIGRSFISQPLNSNKIDISQLQPGIYYITLYGEHEITTSKFIKL